MKLLFFPLSILLLTLVLASTLGMPGQLHGTSRTDAINDTCMIRDRLQSGVIWAIDHEKPDILFLGNSILGEGVDDRKISRLLGTRVMKVWSGGSSSAWWYLVLKNVVSQTAHTPPLVGIFFRDNFLTLPRYRVDGKHKKLIDDFATTNEPVLDRLAYMNDSSWLRNLLSSSLPLFRSRTSIRAAMDDGLKGLVKKMVDSSDVNSSMAAVFDNAKMSRVLLHERQLQDESSMGDPKRDMRFIPDRTFLPFMIEESRRSGFQLFFVRMKRLRDLEPGRESQELVRYMEKLEKYLRERNIPLLDFTSDRRIEKSDFGLGDHLNREAGRAHFSRMLADRMKDFFPGGNRGQ